MGAVEHVHEPARNYIQSGWNTVSNAFQAVKNTCTRYWRRCTNWVLRSRTRKRIFIIVIVGICTALLVVFTVKTFGFGPAGIVAGSTAANIQGAVFGAFVPAGSWFATMTSVGMTGSIYWVAAGLAALNMTGVATWFGLRDYFA